jgi:hypothetical protein
MTGEKENDGIVCEFKEMGIIGIYKCNSRDGKHFYCHQNVDRGCCPKGFKVLVKV